MNAVRNGAGRASGGIMGRRVMHRLPQWTTLDLSLAKLSKHAARVDSCLMLVDKDRVHPERAVRIRRFLGNADSRQLSEGSAVPLCDGPLCGDKSIELFHLRAAHRGEYIC